MLEATKELNIPCLLDIDVKCPYRGEAVQNLGVELLVVKTEEADNDACAKALATLF